MAEVVNAGFVAVKVDREERPDIDAVYMTATTALTGQGGWPMTCFLTPRVSRSTPAPTTHASTSCSCCAPWARRGRSSVPRSSVPARPSSPGSTSSRSCAATHRRGRPREGRGPAARPVRRGPGRLRGRAEVPAVDGAGVPAAPPRPHRVPRRPPDGGADVRGHGTRGMYDQLAGGFARYSVDADWVVPHFEKMLYDNAQLLGLHPPVPDDRFVAGPPDRLGDSRLPALRDLGTREGAFASALDADTDGVEGLTYAWTPAQLAEVLGTDEGARAAELLGVTERGTFEHGTSTCSCAATLTTGVVGLSARAAAAGAGRSAQPARDDKVVTSWNGLAIAGLSDAGVLLGEPSLVERRPPARTSCWTRASSTAGCGAPRATGRWAPQQVSSTTTATSPRGFSRSTRQPPSPVARGCGPAGVARERFAADGGGFHDTADDAERLVTRPRGSGDNAEPSGQSSLAGALLTYAALTGSSGHRQAADGALSAAGLVAARDPRFAGWALAVAEAAVAGPARSPSRMRRARRHRRPRCGRRCCSSGSPGLVLAQASRTHPVYPCWRADRWSTGGRRPTCAAVSSATRRSPSSRPCRRSCGGGAAQAATRSAMSSRDHSSVTPGQPRR